MWTDLATKDLPKPDVRDKGALRMKWLASPITQPRNFEVFLKYVVSTTKGTTPIQSELGNKITE